MVTLSTSIRMAIYHIGAVVPRLIRSDKCARCTVFPHSPLITMPPACLTAPCAALSLPARPMPPKRPRLSASAELENEDLTLAIAATKEKVADAVDSLQSLLVALLARKAALDEKERKQRIVEEEMAMNRERIGSIIKLNLRGKVFKTYKETLLKVEDTYFFRMLSSGLWQPDADGEYFIDTRHEGFDRILSYLSSGELSVEGLNDYEKKCVYDNLDYFQIPYASREWSYNNSTDIGMSSRSPAMCELSDGRLCGAMNASVVVLNLDTKSVELTLTGHTDTVHNIIQLVDGRISSSSRDKTIRVWNLVTETSELTLVGHSGQLWCIAQLLDGRLCSGSHDHSIRVWNLESGLCEQTIDTLAIPFCFAQLSDGLLCTGRNTGHIDVWDIESGLCDLTLEGHTSYVNSIAILGESRICSCSHDFSVKVWNVSSELCERTLVGHANAVFSLVRMRDGRLCTASSDSTMRIWNADTGECEKVLKVDDAPVYRVLQLEDGRLVARVRDGTVRIWS